MVQKPLVQASARFMDAYLLTSKLKERARELGFDLVGATPAVAPPEIEHLEKWMADGLSGRYDIFFRTNRTLTAIPTWFCPA